MNGAGAYKRVTLDPLYQDTISVLLQLTGQAGDADTLEDVFARMDATGCLDPLTASIAIVDEYFENYGLSMAALDNFHPDVAKAMRALRSADGVLKSPPDVVRSGSVAAASYFLTEITAAPEAALDNMFYQYGAGILQPVTLLWVQIAKALIEAPMIHSMPKKVLRSCADFMKVVNHYRKSEEFGELATALLNASIPPAPKPPPPVRRMKVKKPGGKGYRL